MPAICERWFSRPLWSCPCGVTWFQAGWGWPLDAAEEARILFSLLHSRRACPPSGSPSPSQCCGMERRTLQLVNVQPPTPLQEPPKRSTCLSSACACTHTPTHTCTHTHTYGAKSSVHMQEPAQPTEVPDGNWGQLPPMEPGTICSSCAS